MENIRKSKNRKLWVKIFIIILIIAIVAGIYIYKIFERDKQNNQNKEQSNSENVEIEYVPLEISSVNLDEIKSFGVPFVIDFGSDSCIPCKEMAPMLKTLNDEFQGIAIVHFVDVWKNTTAANDFPVSVIPTQIFYNADGNPFIPSVELAQEIEFILYSSKDEEHHLFTVHQGGLTEEEMRKIFSEMGVE